MKSKIKDMKVFSICAASVIVAMSLNPLSAKEKKGVIMTVDGEDIPTEEFIYLFKKNNLQQAQPQTIDEYIDLFETYRLKVAEAKSLGIDTTSNFQKEMAQYRKELLEPYITDTIFFNSLLQEAMEREKTMVESSHIMMIKTHNEDIDRHNLQVLDSLRLELLNGADFIELARLYSQDKFSSDKGGYLGFSPSGTYPYSFETAVYETPEGQISEIVESHVGWHIVKSGARKAVENGKVKSQEDIKTDLARKVSSPFDSRYHKIKRKHIDNLLKKYPDVNIDGLSDDEAYNVLMAREEEYQYKVNPEYRNLVDEYTNGSLLYEVSVENVWNKASNDYEGLQGYYKGHKDKYRWDTPHAKGILVLALTDSVADDIREKIKDMPADSVLPFIKNNYNRNAIAEKFNVTRGVNPRIDNLMFGDDKDIPKFRNFAAYFIVDGRIVENPEDLEDVKSAVINDYQIELEKDWVAGLKKKHKVEINRKELSAVKKMNE